MTLARVEAGEGPVILLVPGFTGSKEDFRLLLDPLAARGFRAVAYDQRGQYESAGADDPAAYAVASLAEDLLSLIDELGGVAHVVGHSFGGLVSREAAIRRPAAVRSLTLLSSGPAALSGPRVEALSLLRPLLDAGGIVAVADALDAVAAALPADQQRPADEAAFLRLRFLRNHPVALLAMADALTSESDRVDQLAASGVAVQVVYGEADDAWPPAVQLAMAERLGARAVVIPEAAHSPAVENPRPVVEALTSFLAQVPAS